LASGGCRHPSADYSASRAMVGGEARKVLTLWAMLLDGGSPSRDQPRVRSADGDVVVEPSTSGI
jgi:hypothetical protein